MKFNENIVLYSIFLLTLIIKLFLFPFTHTVDCDAVSRIFLSMQWYENPHWITNGVWLPFHFYLNSFSFWFYNNWQFSPVFFNILLSCLSIFPFYYFVKNEFNSKGAFYSSILFIISPVLFRNSFMSLSETPFWFFITITLYSISKGFNSKKAIWFFAGGITLTIAAGFRYEAWLLIPLLTILIILRKQWKGGFVFALFSAIFPAVWIYYSLLQSNTFFHPGAPVLSAEIIGNPEFNWENQARKGWFYPLSWVLAVGPITTFFLLKYFKNRGISQNAIIWLIPTLFILAVFLYKSFSGSLMLQHRFTGILAILTIPFFSFYANEKFRNKNIVFGLIIISTIGLSFFYNTRGIALIPRLKDKNAVKVSNIINQNITKESALIIDFDGWENTWFYALKSGLKPENILINYSNNSLDEFLKETEKRINTNSSCMVVLRKGSEVEKYLREKIFPKKQDFRTVYEDGNRWVCLFL